MEIPIYAIGFSECAARALLEVREALTVRKMRHILPLWHPVDKESKEEFLPFVLYCFIQRRNGFLTMPAL